MSRPSSDKRVRFGIVGLGIGRVQGNAIARNPRGQVTAICDIVPEKMDDYARQLAELDPAGHAEVKKYVHYADLCADPEVDAVFVGVPNQLHVPVGLAVVRAGKHILCTKPLSDSEAAAYELVQAAEASGCVHMMSLALRFDAPVQWLGEQARDGRFGKLYYARAHSVRRSGIPDWGAHFVQEGGGAFRDMGVHLLDAAWWLLGCPQPVSVLGVSGAHFGPRGVGYWEFHPSPPDFAAQYRADDFGSGLIRFDNDAAIQVESFWASHQPEEMQITLFGTEAGARLHPVTIYRTEGGSPSDAAVKVLNRPEGFDRIAAHFLECVLDGVPSQAPLRHGLIVQRMLEGVLQSAKQGGEVRL